LATSFHGNLTFRYVLFYILEKRPAGNNHLRYLRYLQANWLLVKSCCVCSVYYSFFLITWVTAFRFDFNGFGFGWTRSGMEKGQMKNCNQLSSIPLNNTTRSLLRRDVHSTRAGCTSGHSRYFQHQQIQNLQAMKQNYL
jgi:hypothetical protein